MPKVSEEHRAKRRQQILRAAMKRFGEGGLHSTSMADVIAESGLSAGAVYLYFKSKDELIAAVAQEVLGGVIARVESLRDAPVPASPGELVCALLDRATSKHQPSPISSLPLLMSVWSEVTRSDAVLRIAEGWITRLRDTITDVVRRWGEHREMPVDADRLAPLIMAMVQGYLLQMVIGTAPPVTEYQESAWAMLTAAGLT
ncbi:TetR family transcriptional regulator [Nakamurella sp. YIM 132087]|uniref:TetR family transcriptional regulator n=1 Tax=Nakamurella alba TaxID=2665158 RepID=A0A7K1FTV0_9ACTN|nr:TetR/AcrR family transcriptional regulator [Nakamurella alba]MTD16234.1 TetR family transcriptional regulator [Nakamurella alba]